MLLSLPPLPLIRLQHPTTDSRLQLPPANGYFGCLLVTHAEPDGHAAALINALLDHGCVYFCCWGVACEQWHDGIDDRIVARGLGAPDEPCIMTTWHYDKPLEEAVWFLQNAAFPDETFEVDYLWQLELEICAGPSTN
ncbi:hypothetical protein SAMN02745857_03032 [Andreprevotia lacus DSM 23236]|jgi:hypothetical protein|uniref:DUF7684 domain-containing protein n=1 Tax=Andreprevotia lacus DSM 23236 TaxID=1121001 RepID=A0A1W1XVP4_9NEIS|nr:hypothetical protein [Andreprevotia lacus]SMC27922.1 hypothetical protein SAMN02745857_03032 [Andreprevotia lacus DSM 23236]